MDQLKHAYIREEDNNPNGVASKANNISKMLEIIDKELSAYFAFVNVRSLSSHIDGSYYYLLRILS